MRIPFPLALNVGTDIIAIKRITKPHTSTSTHLQRLANRFLHPKEITDLTKRFPAWQNSQQDIDAGSKVNIGTWLAGRWAAKEAAKKAWGASLISFRDVRTEVLTGGGVQIICQSYDEVTGGTNGSMEQVGRLSISHDGDYAVATVIASPLHSEILAKLQERKAAAVARVDEP